MCAKAEQNFTFSKEPQNAKMAVPCGSQALFLQDTKLIDTVWKNGKSENKNLREVCSGWLSVYGSDVKCKVFSIIILW